MRRDARSETLGTASPRHSGWRARLWAAGCLVLIGLVGADWASLPSGSRLQAPTSPLDNVAGLSKEPMRFGWGFLWQVRAILPAGSTYTVVAGDAESEWNIYKLSLAVLTECRGLPSSYYLGPRADTGARARYVLVYGCVAKPAGATLVQELGDGCVWERSAL